MFSLGIVCSSSFTGHSSIQLPISMTVCLDVSFLYVGVCIFGRMSVLSSGFATFNCIQFSKVRSNKCNIDIQTSSDLIIKTGATGAPCSHSGVNSLRTRS